MVSITKPLPFPELTTQPELPSRIRISDDMQQSLALLSGYDGQQRKLVAVTPSGALVTTSVRPKGVINITGDGANDDWQGSDIKCSEVKVLSHKDNAALIWVNINTTADEDVGEPLEAGDYLIWGLSNLVNLHINIVGASEKVIVTYG